MEKHIFELLAPAGSPETLRAVIAAGADAVYVGGKRFGARAYADNFSEEELLEAIDFVHLHGAKLYLTVNTLLRNEELEELYDYLLPLYRQGLDAALVQDIGVMSFLHRFFPELAIHTSTQMTLTGADGIKLLKEYGIRRVVLPRELSLAEMRQIRDETGMELEAFVHGALCYCYSGQCLMSSVFGGRSGNRGRCAQPCRLPYAVEDESGRTLRETAYLLSMKDQRGIARLAGLREAGVYSLKIEGRMKQTSYAAGVVKVYREAIDRLSEQIGTYGEPLPAGEWKPTETELARLAESGSRNGFTDAYFMRQNGADMLTETSPGYRRASSDSTVSAKAEDEILKSAASEGGAKMPSDAKIPLTGQARFLLGRPAELTVGAAGKEATVTAEPPQRAERTPVTEEELRARLGRTGDTPFSFAQLSVEADDRIFYPNGAVNRLRRDAIAELTRRLTEPFRRQPPGRRPERDESGRGHQTPAGEIAFTASVWSREQLSEVLREPLFTEISLELAACEDPAALREDIAAVRRAHREVVLNLPYIFRKAAKERYMPWLWELSEECGGFLVRNYEELGRMKTEFPGRRIIADAGLYSWNDEAVRALRGLGAGRNTVPLELNRRQIAGRDNTDSRMLVYGYYPLMISAQCIHGNTGGCDRRMTLCYLKDRYHNRLPVRNFCGACYNVICNALPTMLLDRIDELQACGIKTFRLSFTVESGGEVRRICRLLPEYQSKGRTVAAKGNAYTNGHYTRGVE